MNKKEYFMNRFLFIILFCITNNFVAFSLGDTLIIRFKNSFVEKIPLIKIHKIIFENPNIVEESNSVSSLTTKGNYPNPFSEKTLIEFELSTEGDVQIVIFDHNGKQIQTINRTNCSAGKNKIEWNCRDKDEKPVLPGVYFYQVRFNKEVQCKKMILVK